MFAVVPKVTENCTQDTCAAVPHGIDNCTITNYSTVNAHPYVLHLNSAQTFTLKNFNNHTRHPIVELRLQIRVPSIIV
jgi:hypothetical protein